MEKFEVGDKVKIVRMDTKWSAYHKWMNAYIGATGKIVKTEGLVSDDDPYHDVEFLNGLKFSIKDEWLELVEKTGWNGKVVCVGVNTNSFPLFNIGKVYECKNGYLIDNENNERKPWNFLNQYTSFEDLTRYTSELYTFIEFKGFAGK